MHPGGMRVCLPMHTGGTGLAVLPGAISNCTGLVELNLGGCTGLDSADCKRGREAALQMPTYKEAVPSSDAGDADVVCLRHYACAKLDLDVLNILIWTPRNSIMAVSSAWQIRTCMTALASAISEGDYSRAWGAYSPACMKNLAAEMPPNEMSF